MEELLTALNTEIIKHKEKIDDLEKKLLEANKTIVSIDNLSLEESGYSYACDTHDHNDCGDCVVNMAKNYIKKHS